LLPEAEVDYIVIGDGIYMFPRRDGILLGGTFEHGVWSEDVNEEARQRILAGHRALFGGMREGGRHETRKPRRRSPDRSGDDRGVRPGARGGAGAGALAREDALPRRAEPARPLRLARLPREGRYPEAPRAEGLPREAAHDGRARPGGPQSLRRVEPARPRE